MCRRFINLLVVAMFLASLLAWGQSAGSAEAPKQDGQKPEAVQNGGDFANPVPGQPVVPVPKDVIIVKGAWASASDSTTPVPEGGRVSGNIFNSPYFGISLTFPQEWHEKFQGPPPSDSGRYVLAQLDPTDSYKGTSRGTILITADDMFFTNLPAKNALEVVNYSKDHMLADHQVELKPIEMTLGGRPFTFFAYWSPVAQIHWYVLATEIRCHTVQIVLTGRDTKLLENLMKDMDKMKLPDEAGPAAGTGGGTVPVCIKDYANSRNLVTRVDPVLTEHRFNPVPVRIIIDKEGKVKFMHFISAFADQSQAITEALQQWRFKPYLRDGKPVEVETGIMFGRSFNSTPVAKVPTAD